MMGKEEIPLPRLQETGPCTPVQAASPIGTPPVSAVEKTLSFPISGVLRKVFNLKT